MTHLRPYCHTKLGVFGTGCRPVAAFIRATNIGSRDALLATFADDALVNDQLHDDWGREAIAAQAERDVIGER